MVTLVPALIGHPSAQQAVTLDIAGASALPDGPTGGPSIELALTKSGQASLAAFTAEYSGKTIDVLIDGEVMMSPFIQTPIFSPSLIITGAFTMQEAKQIASELADRSSVVTVRPQPKRKAGERAT